MREMENKTDFAYEKWFEDAIKRDRKINGYLFPKVGEIPVEIAYSMYREGHVEFVNLGTEEVVWLNDIVALCRPMAEIVQFHAGCIGERSYIVRPMESVILPHKFYSAGTKSGAPPIGHFRYGDEIGKKDLTVSAPEAWKKSF